MSLLLKSYLKLVELKAIKNKAKFVDLKVCKKISDFLKENFVEDLTYFENKNKIKIDIITDNTLNYSRIYNCYKK